MDVVLKMNKMNSSPLQTTEHPLILVVDDERLIRLSVAATLTAAGYRVLEAEDGAQALQLVAQAQPDMVILDVVMPKLDGFAVCTQLRNELGLDTLPILMATGLNDEDSIDRAYAVGATDFVSKPLNLKLLAYRVRYLLRAAEHLKELQRGREQLRTSHLEIINRLGIAADYRDNETGKHIYRMSRYSELMARELGLDEEQRELILHAAPMHDIGKIGIPDQILLKPGRLTVEEFEQIKRHPLIGATMLAGDLSPLIQMAHTIALTHHEKWDGSGYPHGLVGEEIPLPGRICALADVFDALTTARPYKEAWSLERAVAEIHMGSGSHFDPQVVTAFEATFEGILAIKQSHQDGVSAD